MPMKNGKKMPYGKGTKKKTVVVTKKKPMTKKK